MNKIFKEVNQAKADLRAMNRNYPIHPGDFKNIMTHLDNIETLNTLNINGAESELNSK